MTRVLRLVVLLSCFGGMAEALAEVGFASHHITHVGGHYGYDTAKLKWTYTGDTGTYHVQFDGAGGYGVITCVSGACTPSESSELTVSGTFPITRTIRVQETGRETGATFTQTDQEYTIHGGQQTVVGTQAVNLGTPTDCAWTMDWTLNANCPGGTVTTHTIGVLVDGVHMSGSPTTVDAGYDAITGTTGATSPSGSVITFQLDGAVLATHTVNCPVDGQPPPDPNVWTVNGNLTETCTGSPTPTTTPTPAPTTSPVPTPTPNPSPSPFPTPGPAPSPMPPGSPPPGPTAPPGGSPGANGNVNVLNASDFYAPVKKALEDAQSAIAPPPDNGNSGGAMGDGPPATEPIERGELDNLKPKLEQIVAHKTNIVTYLRGKIEGFGETIDSMPTSFGTVTSVPIPFNAFSSVVASVGDTSQSLNLPSIIDLSNWQPQIAMIRLVLLWILRCVFWIKIIQLFAAQGTGTKAVA